MLTVCGKIMASRASSTGNSVAVNIGGTWVYVAKGDIESFKNAIGAGKPIEVRARTDLALNEDGTYETRTFKKRDGSQGEGPNIRVRFWYRGGASANNPLAGLVGSEAAAGAADTEDPQ